jgi:hypothetical protein
MNRNIKQHKGYEYHLLKMFLAQAVKTPTNITNEEKLTDSNLE